MILMARDRASVSVVAEENETIRLFSPMLTSHYKDGKND